MCKSADYGLSLKSIKSSFLTLHQRQKAALPEGPHKRAINKKMIQGLPFDQRHDIYHVV